jgi:hypothetical protein
MLYNARRSTTVRRTTMTAKLFLALLVAIQLYSSWKLFKSIKSGEKRSGWLHIDLIASCGLLIIAPALFVDVNLSGWRGLVAVFGTALFAILPLQVAVVKGCRDRTISRST